MRRSSLLACGFVGVLTVSAVLVSVRTAESRTQRTLDRAELYEVLGGFINDYCCANSSDCVGQNTACNIFLDQETCEAAREYIVTTGNMNSCSAATIGATCSNTGTYICTNIWTCIWDTTNLTCDSNTFYGTYNAPQNCSDSGPPTCPN